MKRVKSCWMILAKVFVYNPVVLKQMRSLLTHLKTLTTYTIKLYLMIVAFYKLVSSQSLKTGKSFINQMIIINIFFWHSTTPIAVYKLWSLFIFWSFSFSYQLLLGKKCYISIMKNLKADITKKELLPPSSAEQGKQWRGSWFGFLRP